MDLPQIEELVRESLSAVRGWVEASDYKGYDPGDGLTSWLRPLTLGNLFAERILQQVIWKSPVNLRPFVGVKPLDSTKGRGFMAWGYLMLHSVTGDDDCKARALECLDWLGRNRVAAGAPGYSWGNHFDFTTRSGRMPAHQPTIVWSGLIGQAFLEAYEQTGEGGFLEIAQGICTWILGVPREKTSTGTCLSYVGYKQNSIHNSNLLGAALLARTWKHTRTPEYREVAREAVEYTCTRQRPDGSWYYGEEPKYQWIDNFHTAYNLDSLKRYIDCTGDETLKVHLSTGYRYFNDVFFEANGRPKYYNNSTYPVDIQCAAQAIDTFSFFSAEEVEALENAARVARWTIENMQDKRKGYFYYRQYPALTAKTPYFHWGQATMFKALAHLLCKLRDVAAPRALSGLPCGV